jgi:hypothetical protein
VSESSFFKPRYGKATEDRDTRQKIADENWVPVGVDPEHRFDSRIAQLEAAAAQAKYEQELQQAPNEAARELIVLKHRRNAELAAQDMAAEREQRLQPVAKEIKALQDLRAKLEQDPNTVVSRLVAIDKALAQYAEVGNGVDRRHGDTLYKQIRDSEAKLVADKRATLTQQRIALELEMSKLDAAIENPTAEPEPAPKVTVPSTATLAERGEALWNAFKERADTVALIELAELQHNGDATALEQFVNQHTTEAPVESSAVFVEGSSE